MPNLTFVMPHWLYWSGLLLFPLAAMYIVRRQRRLGTGGGVNLPTAYLFLVTAGFMGIHRFYLKNLWGIIFIPLFVAVLLGNVQHRQARLVASEAENQVKIAEFDLENAQKAVQDEREGAAEALPKAEQALTDAKAHFAAASVELDKWDSITFWLGVLIGALLLIDAALLPGLTRRAIDREGRGPPPGPEPVAEPPQAGTHEAPEIAVHTRVTDVIDRINGFFGEFVCYWSLIAVFVYYYEVLARYVFNSPTNWAHESMFLMFGMQYLISGGFAYREDAHVRVDVVYLLLPDRAKIITDITTSIFFFIFTIALAWTGFTFAMDSISVWEVSFTEWAIQYWPVKITIGLGALLLLLQGGAKLIKDVVLLAAKEA